MRRAEAEPIFRIKIPRVGERAVRTRNEQGWPCTGPYTGRPNKVQYFCFVAANGNILEAEARGAPALLPPVSSVSLANFCPDLRYTRKILQRILQRPPSSYASMQKIAKDDPFEALLSSSSRSSGNFIIPFFRATSERKNL